MLKIDAFRNSLKPDQLLIRLFSKNRSNVILVTEVEPNMLIFMKNIKILLIVDKWVELVDYFL